MEALTTKNVELEKEIGGLSAALEEREHKVTAFQKDDGEEVLKISAMEQEIAELKVKLCQAQSLKEQKQIQRDVMLQDGEKVEQFAIELQALLGKNGMYDRLCSYIHCSCAILRAIPIHNIYLSSTQNLPRSLHNLEAVGMSFSTPL